MTMSVIVLTIVWGVTFFILLLLHCDLHFAAWWTSIGEVGTYCKTALDYSSGWTISDFVVDLIVIILPLHMVSNNPQFLKRVKYLRDF